MLRSLLITSFTTKKLNFDNEELADFNKQAITFLDKIRLQAHLMLLVVV